MLRRLLGYGIDIVGFSLIGYGICGPIRSIYRARLHTVAASATCRTFAIDGTGWHDDSFRVDRHTRRLICGSQEKNGGLGGNRTHNPLIKSQVL